VTSTWSSTKEAASQAVFKAPTTQEVTPELLSWDLVVVSKLQVRVLEV